MRAAWGHLLCFVQIPVSHGQQPQCLGLPSLDRLQGKLKGQMNLTGVAKSRLKLLLLATAQVFVVRLLAMILNWINFFNDCAAASILQNMHQRLYTSECTTKHLLFALWRTTLAEQTFG